MANLRGKLRLEELEDVGVGGVEEPKAGQLLMENAIFLTHLDQEDEKSQGTRKRIAINSVMLAHLAMKIYFLRASVRN